MIPFLLLFLDWPQFLGPLRNGAYPASDVAWPSAIAWQREVGAGFAGPVIAGSKVILFHRRDRREVVEAFDAASGKTLWTFDYKTGYKDDFGFDEGPRATPAVDSGRVFTYGAEGILHAIDLESGKMLWRADAQHAFQGEKGFFGAGCSPLIANGAVVLNVGRKSGGIVAFDAATGKVKWKSTNYGASYSSPVLAPFGLVFFTAKGVAVLHPETGKVLHETPWRSPSHVSVNAASPVVSGDAVFVTASYGLGALALDFSEMPPKTLWSNDESLSAHYATPVLIGPSLYGLHGRSEGGRQELRAVEFRTGKVAWTMPFAGSGSLTLIGKHLMALRDDGQIFQIAPSPKELQVLGNFRPLQGKFRAYPAVGAGMVCVRNAATTLTCLK